MLKTKQPVVMSLRSVPSVMAAQEKLNELHHELAEAEAHLNTFAVGERDPMAEAKRYLAGDRKPVSEKTPEKHAQARARVRLIRDAIGLQEREVVAVEDAAKAVLRKEILPEHRKLAQQVGAALDQLKAALLAEATLREEINCAGIGATCPLCFAGFYGAGTVNTTLGKVENIDRWREEMSRADYL